MIFRSLVIALLFTFAVSLPCFANPQTWYFVRHFEKQTGDNPSLTALGQGRAEQLVTLFKDKAVTAIYSTDYNRTTETVTPISIAKNLDIQFYNPSQLPEFAEQLKSQNNVLVVGHSNTTPELLVLLGGATIEMTDTDYGELYMLTKVSDKFTTDKLNVGAK